MPSMIANLRSQRFIRIQFAPPGRFDLDPRKHPVELRVNGVVVGRYSNRKLAEEQSIRHRIKMGYAAVEIVGDASTTGTAPPSPEPRYESTPNFAASPWPS